MGMWGEYGGITPSWMGHGSIQKDPGMSIQSLQILSSSPVEIEIYDGVDADWEKLHWSKYLAKFWFSVSHFEINKFSAINL